MVIVLQDVPDDGAAADLDERLGAQHGLFTHPGALTAGEDHGFHDVRALIVPRPARCRNTLNDSVSVPQP